MCVGEGGGGVRVFGKGIGQVKKNRANTTTDG